MARTIPAGICEWSDGRTASILHFVVGGRQDMRVLQIMTSSGTAWRILANHCILLWHHEFFKLYLYWTRDVTLNHLGDRERSNQPHIPQGHRKASTCYT
jgi:hypothetical protein